MSKRLPFWKTYEVPEQCEDCPYITSLERTIEDQSGAVGIDGIAALGIAGLSSELRGRKRRAQDCLGPVVVNDGVTLCKTVGNYIDEAGCAIKDKLDIETSRLLDEVTIEDFLEDKPPEEQ